MGREFLDFVPVQNLFMTVIRISRDDMDVGVRDSRAHGLIVDGVGTKDSFQCNADFLRNLKIFPEIPDFVHPAAVLLGDHQGMTLGEGIDIKKGEKVPVLIDPIAVILPVHNAAKNTFHHMGHFCV
jgi:hypothetical protein